MIINPTPQSFCYIAMMLCFLNSKRFKTGLKKRALDHEDLGFSTGFRFKNIIVAVKVIAYYIYLSFWPSRLGFFHSFGKDEDKEGKLWSPTLRFYLSIVIIALFITLSVLINLNITIWMILFLGVFSQVVAFGQFIAERYLYIFNVGFCYIIAQILAPYPEALIVLASLWFYRSHLYVPYWKHNVNLFSQSISAFPEADENYNNYGLFLLERGKAQQALMPLLHGLALTKGNKARLHAHIGKCYAILKYYDKALYHIKEAMKTCDKDKYANLRDCAWELNEKCKKHKRALRQLNQ